jgi:imidazolonepropionase-like amidohydrolase
VESWRSREFILEVRECENFRRLVGVNVLRFLIGFVLATAFGLAAQVVPATPRKVVTIIRNVTVIDPGTNLIAHHWSVAISDGRIQAIGAVAEPPDATIIDGSNRFLIPGLWDMHVHLWNENNLPQLYLAFGVTGVRDMGSKFEKTSQLRKAIESNAAIGPHILTSGPGLNGKPGDEPRLPILTVTTPEQGRHAVDEVHDMGADFVKVFDQLELEPYVALLERARQLRMPVAGHLPWKVKIEEAIEAKQASIEHLYGLERISEARLRKAFVEATRMGTRFAPTLSMHRRTLLVNAEGMKADARVGLIPEAMRKDWGDPVKDFAAASAEFHEKAPRTYVHYQEITRWLKQSGVTILAGSDTGDPFTIPGGSLQDELALLVEAGLTPMEALRGATSEAVKFLEVEQLFGGIRTGMSADMVLLEGDPLADIANVRRIAGVWWRGRYYDWAGIEKLKAGQAR